MRVDLAHSHFYKHATEYKHEILNSIVTIYLLEAQAPHSPAPFYIQAILFVNMEFPPDKYFPPTFQAAVYSMYKIASSTVILVPLSPKPHTSFPEASEPRKTKGKKSSAGSSNAMMPLEKL